MKQKRFRSRNWDSSSDGKPCLSVSMAHRITSAPGTTSNRISVRAPLFLRRPLLLCAPSREPVSRSSAMITPCMRFLFVGPSVFACGILKISSRDKHPCRPRSADSAISPTYSHQAAARVQNSPIRRQRPPDRDHLISLCKVLRPPF